MLVSARDGCRASIFDIVDKNILIRAIAVIFRWAGAAGRVRGHQAVLRAGSSRVPCQDDRMLRLPGVNFLYMGSFFTFAKTGYAKLTYPAPAEGGTGGDRAKRPPLRRMR
jgi:hypothetical protein